LSHVELKIYQVIKLTHHFSSRNKFSMCGLWWLLQIAPPLLKSKLVLLKCDKAVVQISVTYQAAFKERYSIMQRLWGISIAIQIDKNRKIDMFCDKWYQSEEQRQAIFWLRRIKQLGKRRAPNIIAFVKKVIDIVVMMIQRGLFVFDKGWLIGCSNIKSV